MAAVAIFLLPACGNPALPDEVGSAPIGYVTTRAAAPDGLSGLDAWAGTAAAPALTNALAGAPGLIPREQGPLEIAATVRHTPSAWLYHVTLTVSGRADVAPVAVTGFGSTLRDAAAAAAHSIRTSVGLPDAVWPDPAASLEEGLLPLLRRCGDRAAAADLAAARAAWRRYPERAGGFVLAARMARVGGDIGTARASAQAALLREPLHPLARLESARLLLADGDAEGARAALATFPATVPAALQEELAAVRTLAGITPRGSP